MSSARKFARSDGRKKFAVPPVKNACLTCRSSRVRCDGGEPCSGCAKKGKDCVYTQSRRGGPRIAGLKRGNSAGGSSSGNYGLQQTWPSTALEESVLPLMEPGAGLIGLDEYSDTDNLFDSIFTGPETLQSSHQSGLAADLQKLKVQNALRLYTTNDELIAAYYIWLHPFFPILPPPSEPYSALRDSPAQGMVGLSSVESLTTEDASPLSLTLSAVLVLIPHQSAINPSDDSQVALRRRAAHMLATRALQSIENDSELPDSALSPSRALCGTKKLLLRNPLHPTVPVELEATISLCILSIYEYAQRGNLTKMRQRAMHALDSAMELSLHFDEGQHEQFVEARRRAWWMSYMCACQASIVGCTKTGFSPLDPRYTTEYPTNVVDAEVWSIFIRAQRAILSATQFVVDFNESMERKEDMSFLGNRMQELDSLLEPLIQASDSWCLDFGGHNSSEPEATVALSLRMMAKIKLNSARIKVHRYCAFFDIPVFTKKHCDLKEFGPPTSWSDDEVNMVSSCCSTTTFQTFQGSEAFSTSEASSYSTNSSISTSPSSSATSVSGCSVTTTCHSPAVLPFSNHVSSRICLKSALSIARAFDVLPIPSAVGAADPRPRMMPSFACCAMQSAYALLMMHHKTSVMLSGDPQRDSNIQKLLSQCEQGLFSVLAALDNYSISFEAMHGMRDQVRDAINCLLIPFM